MTDQELKEIIGADAELDFDGQTAILRTDDHIMECWFSAEMKDEKVVFNLTDGKLRDSGEGKEIELTNFQSELIEETIRPHLESELDAGLLVEMGLLDFDIKALLELV